MRERIRAVKPVSRKYFNDRVPLFHSDRTGFLEDARTIPAIILLCVVRSFCTRLGLGYPPIQFHIFPIEILHSETRPIENSRFPYAIGSFELFQPRLDPHPEQSEIKLNFPMVQRSVIIPLRMYLFS